MDQDKLFQLLGAIVKANHTALKQNAEALQQNREFLQFIRRALKSQAGARSSRRRGTNRVSDPRT
jgi:hypothetical protein